ncbi:MAG: helix-turn-helix transcriptional regulator [Actinomycetota bacterium]
MSNLDDLDGLSDLADPVRRALYRHVVGAGQPVGRDAAAGAVGISRSLAAYHLDRLVEAGLLDARYERLGGRRGPGAGRPSKLYTRSPSRFQVTVPARDYELAARLLATSVEGDERARNAVARVARTFGKEIAAEVQRRCSDASVGDIRRCLLEVLEEHGYEPYVDEGAIRMRNCPFDALATEHRDLVCNMNLEMMKGAAGAIDDGALRPRLDPRPAQCCVVFEEKHPA